MPRWAVLYRKARSQCQAFETVSFFVSILKTCRFCYVSPDSLWKLQDAVPLDKARYRSYRQIVFRFFL
jgi:hypothetical protein